MSSPDNASWFLDPSQFPEPSDFSKLPLLRLRDDLIRLAREFHFGNRSLQFRETVRLRNNAVKMYNQATRGNHIDLAFTVAGACGLLAEVRGLHGDREEAVDDLRMALEFASYTDSDALRAWLLAVCSMNAYWSGAPRRARDFARQGQRFGVAGSVASFLPMLEARASAALGQVEDSYRYIERAIRQREDSPARNDMDFIGGEFYFDPAWQNFCQVMVGFELRDPDMMLAAAHATLIEYNRIDEDSRNPDILAQSQARAATAYVMRRELDAVPGALGPVLALPEGHGHADLNLALGFLRHELLAPDVRDSVIARDTVRWIEGFVSVPVPER